jgi:hypothetical protein
MQEWTTKVDSIGARHKLTMEAMRAPGENKPNMRIFTVGEHEQSAEILKGILRHVELQAFKKCGLGGEGSPRWANRTRRAFGGGSATAFVHSS